MQIQQYFFAKKGNFYVIFGRFFPFFRNFFRKFFVAYFSRKILRLAIFRFSRKTINCATLLSRQDHFLLKSMFHFNLVSKIWVHFCLIREGNFSLTLWFTDRYFQREINLSSSFFSLILLIFENFYGVTFFS